MKKNFLLTTLALSITILSQSCNKENNSITKSEKETLSLKELTAISTGKDKEFLLKTKITKNDIPLNSKINKVASTEFSTKSVEAEENLVAWPKLKWGFGVDCNRKPGICLIFGAMEQELPLKPLEESDWKITLIEDKLIINPIESGEGLTSDYYLPITSYVPVTPNLAIKPGIYEGNATAVVVDLVHIN
ncbi:hypothetical protein [Sphingobacterium rhinopitheci]|uniref:hypothetical protein n=1 Tax=Sphingobacterium rhinopitheci TaxID=2781960 RepID=UPI001F5249BD|nr:hypothetical protein [Sphingobacterium rhinopitheci]MCI0922788.1 hypothetical protein [Sphingobacterium rhinopitheci]